MFSFFLLSNTIGVATLYYSPPIFFFSEYEGGLLLNGYTEPEGVMKVEAAGVVTWESEYDEEDHTLIEEMLEYLTGGEASLTLTLTVTLVNMSFPGAAGFNFNTWKGGARVTMRTLVLGNEDF